METTGRRIDLKAAVEDGRAFIVEQPLEWKEAEADGGGDAATSSLPVRTLISTPSLDLHGHIVKTSAFEDTFAGMFGQRPLMLAYHKWDRPIGLWPDKEIRPAEVFLGGAITGKTNDGREMQALVKDGIVNGSSIGWWPGQNDGDVVLDEESDALIINRLDLFEGSLVPMPANLDTFVEVTKAWCDRWVKSYKQNYRNRSVIAPRPARASSATAARVIPIEAWASLAKCGTAIANRVQVGKSIRATVGASVDALSPPVPAGGEDDE